MRWVGIRASPTRCPTIGRDRRRTGRWRAGHDRGGGVPSTRLGGMLPIRFPSQFRSAATEVVVQRSSEPRSVRVVRERKQAICQWRLPLRFLPVRGGGAQGEFPPWGCRAPSIKFCPVFEESRPPCGRKSAHHRELRCARCQHPLSEAVRAQAAHRSESVYIVFGPRQRDVVDTNFAPPRMREKVFATHTHWHDERVRGG